MPIRNSVKAVIIKDEKILLTKNEDDLGVFYLCPGGGQEHKEDFHEALQRECMEEIGVPVEIGDLLFIREYIGERHEFAESDVDIHQVEFFFSCTIKDFSDAKPLLPDDHQIGVEWLPINELMSTRLYPIAIRQYLVNQLNHFKTPIYLGAMN